jgi:hypothetical protein
LLRARWIGLQHACRPRLSAIPRRTASTTPAHTVRCLTGIWAIPNGGEVISTRYIYQIYLVDRLTRHHTRRLFCHLIACKPLTDKLTCTEALRKSAANAEANPFIIKTLKTKSQPNSPAIKTLRKSRGEGGILQE